MKNGTILFISLNRSENSTLEGREFPPSEIIDTVDEIYTTEKGENRNRIIRYKPGEKSIFLDEQSGAYNKDGKIIKHGAIVITNGILAVSEKETLLLKYLRACNGFAGNKYRMPGRTALFTERDVELDAQTYLKEEKADRALLNMIDSLEPDELESYALVLGDTEADKKKTSEVRRDLIIYAKQQPERFRDAIKNVDLKRKVSVIKALKDGYIKYDESNNVISWKDGKEITRCPIGKDPADYLVELSYQPLYEKVFASIESRKNMTKITVNTSLNNKGETDLELVESAMKGGVFDKKGLWYRLEINGELCNIGRGASEIQSKIQFDDTLKKLIRDKVYTLEPA